MTRATGVRGGRPGVVTCLLTLAVLGCAEHRPEPGPEPIAQQRLLVLELEPGYRIAEGGGAFVSPRGDRVDLPGLPPGAELVYMVPDLADRAPRSLSKDEADLARYAHLLLPSGSNREQVLRAAGRWPGVAEVRLPPAISLP